MATNRRRCRSVEVVRGGEGRFDSHYHHYRRGEGPAVTTETEMDAAGERTDSLPRENVFTSETDSSAAASDMYASVLNPSGVNVHFKRAFVSRKKSQKGLS